VIHQEIDKIENILDGFGDDNFFLLASEQGGLEKILAFAKVVAKVQASIVLKTEYYGALEYKTAISYDEKEGCYTASIPDLPGCIGKGYTEKEALDNLKKDKNRWIENAINKGITIPEPSKNK
jgi:predicted RNase H-like HicB family nuclease